MKLEIEYIKIGNLKPYEKNARKHQKEDVETIKASIKEFGMCDPIGIWGKKNIIVEGHGRLMALKELGYEEVPCIRLDFLSDEQRRAYALAHNKTAEMSDWDFDLLDSELDNILDIDMTEFGFEIEEEEPEVTEDDYEVLVLEEPKAKLGDIYQLGGHRLMCGDSTKAEDVAKLMDGKKADMAFMDPPYGMKKESEGVKNDNLNFEDLLEFNKQWIPITFSALKENGSWYCWGMDEPLMDIYSNILKPMIKENKITFRNLITWDKRNGQGQLSEKCKMYPTADEKCLFVMCGVQGFNNNSDNYFEKWEPIRTYLCEEAKKVGLNSAKLKEICGVGMYSHWFSKSQWQLIPEEHYKKLQEFYKNEAFKREYEAFKREWYDTRAFFDNTHDNMNNVWHFERTSGEERESAGDHATPKPIALCARAIKSSSRQEETVLDVFGGSGSTLMACEQTNRKCFTMELEPKWVDVIINRWEQFTGKKAVRINEG